MSSTLQKQIERWVKSGRGRGVGEAYQPWLTAKAVPSRGRTFRPKGIRTGREHLFLSEWEYFYFLLLDWSSTVLDIREQFPLLDVEGFDISETIAIANELGVAHPMDRPDNKLKVITTDYLIDFPNYQLAVSFKETKSITDREIEKMEIERIYWERRGVSWEIVSEKDIPIIFAKNIDYVHSTFYFDDYHIPASTVVKARRVMEPMLLKRDKKLTDVTNYCDDRLGLEPGESLAIVRYLIISKQWKVDMDALIETNQPLLLESISLPEQEGRTDRIAN